MKDDDKIFWLFIDFSGLFFSVLNFRYKFWVKKTKIIEYLRKYKNVIKYSLSC